jgi:hypothetical protein
LDHSYKVGAENSADSGDDAGNERSLRGFYRSLQKLVDDVHHVVDRGGYVGYVGGGGGRGGEREGKVGGCFVELEGFFDGASAEERGHYVERTDESVLDFLREVGVCDHPRER